MSWKDLLGTVAPTLVTALDGPLAGVALKGIASALGCTADEESITAAVLAADPHVLAELKKAELQFKKDMKELGLEIEKVHQINRDSARKREMTVSGFANPMIAFFILSGFFGVVAALFFVPMTAGAKNLFLCCLAHSGTMATQVVAYYFGSSSGSKQKTMMLGEN